MQNEYSLGKIPNNIHDIYLYKKSPFLYAAEEEGCSEIITFSFVGVFIDFETLKSSYLEIKKDLFIYFDDVYYSWSLKKMGCKMIYNQNSFSIMMLWNRLQQFFVENIYYPAKFVLSGRIFI